MFLLPYSICRFLISMFLLPYSIYRFLISMFLLPYSIYRSLFSMFHLLCTIFRFLFFMSCLSFYIFPFSFPCRHLPFSRSGLPESISYRALSMFRLSISNCRLFFSISTRPATKHGSPRPCWSYRAAGSSGEVSGAPGVPVPNTPCFFTSLLNTNISFFSLSVLNNCCPMVQMSIA